MSNTGNKINIVNYNSTFYSNYSVPRIRGDGLKGMELLYFMSPHNIKYFTIIVIMSSTIRC